ncbi:MAG: hypothetical protein ACTINM_08485 [Acetobacter cibinongensis]
MAKQTSYAGTPPVRPLLAVSLMYGAQGIPAGLANAVQVIAFLLGMVLGGAGTLLLYNKIGWSGAMLAMAAELLVLWVLLLPLRSSVEPDAAGMAYDRSRLRDLLQQQGFVWAALVAVTFKFAGTALSMLVQPWLMDNAFSLDFAGTIQTVSLVASAVGGALLGFPAVRWLGSRRAAFWLVFPSTALLGSVWAVQSLGWATPEVLVGCFSLESFFDGGFYVSIWAMLMNWSSVERPGTDYSVLQCGESLANVLAGFLVAPLASVLGYMPTFFGIWGVGAGLLGVLLLAVKKLATLCCDDQPHSNLHHTL